MASTANPVVPRIKPGVAPLRAGEGTSFLLRRLHSLSGVVPIGAFLLEHFISNAEAFKGPIAYGKQVEFLNSFPAVFLLELCFIWLPILYHGLYGIYIWYRGDTNVAAYPWTGNWLYTSQRWTGIIAASWHFSYGLWLFAAKWGITTGERARRRLGYLCLALALGLVSIGAISMYGFLKTPQQPLDSTSSSENIVMR